MLVASKRSDGADLREDPGLREMSSDPRDANVLVTDGRSVHSRALVRALAAAGAARIWVGMDSSGESFAVPQGLRDLPQVTCLRMDVTDAACVRAAASAIASEIDILINTAHVPSGSGVSPGTDVERSEMEFHYFGLLNLARHFGSPLRERALRAKPMCPAWVNVLSVSGLPGYPPWGTYGASMAAARSLSQALRGELREAGVRLVNVYPGPLDDEHSQEHQLPKLAPSVLGKSVVEALQAGVEEVYPGEVAQEWLESELDRRSGAGRTRRVAEAKT